MDTITNPLKSKNKINTNIETFNIMFNKCPEAIIYKDKNFNYCAANQSFRKLFNTDFEKQFIGKNELDFLSSENIKTISEVNLAVKNELQSINYVMSAIRKDKSPLILNINSYPVCTKNQFEGIISIIKDITNEEKLKESFVSKHFQLKSFFENIPMLIYMQDTKSNFIIGTKPAQKFINIGYDIFSDIEINPTKYKSFEQNKNNFVLKNNKAYIGETSFIDTKESQHWYKIFKIPINDINGEVCGIITVADNIDAEKQLQAQRETFVASVGHDLKNPTIAQIRSLELLLKGEFGDLKYDQKVLLEMILDSCKYMNGMLSTLLATYRNFDGAAVLKYSEFSFPDLVMECIGEMIYVAKDKNIEILLDNKLSDEIVNADRIQIKRVIMNLLSNGVKYAFKNSILKICLFDENNQLCFEFQNDSPYIPPAKQKTIFAQYVTYASAHKELGIGLGLYTSQKIIEAHGGKMYVQSFINNKNIFGFKIFSQNENNNINQSIVL